MQFLRSNFPSHFLKIIVTKTCQAKVIMDLTRFPYITPSFLLTCQCPCS